MLKMKNIILCNESMKLKNLSVQMIRYILHNLYEFHSNL
jgi:hypothetical protein